jgi:UDP-N-acetylglucosamine 2-epimerase (non-hydrolysing)
MLTAMVIMGTRPEVIKLAPVVNLLQQNRDVQVRVVFTGQHRELVAGLMDFFGVIPDLNLDVMGQDQSIARTASAVLKGVDDYIAQHKPDVLLVQGDTTSAFAAASGAYFRQVPIAHVEAGLRTQNKFSPFPEEMNRRWIAAVADLNFAPTLDARANLLREGICEQSIYVTGNTGIDAVLETARRLQGTDPPVPVRTNKPFLLVTVHRRENHGQRLREICAAIRELIEMFPRYDAVLPVHANPNVKSVIYQELNGVSGIHLVPPLDYISFVNYMRHARVIITDSGGVQEEAPVFRKPVFVLRDNTERPEGIVAGLAELVGWRKERIISRVGTVLSDPDFDDRIVSMRNPYGDGLASSRICTVIGKFLGVRSLETETSDFLGNPLALESISRG